MSKMTSHLIHSSHLIQPQERLKHLIDYSNAVEVDFHIPPARYYRSGLEMVRMANVYYNEGNLENAYVLYLKFMTLFLEKIRKHPEFNTVPVKVKAVNQSKLREVLPKAEKLKEQLLSQYQEEYKRYVAERKRKQQQEKEELRNFSRETIGTGTGTLFRGSGSTGVETISNFADVKIPQSIDNVNYPDPNIPSAPSVHLDDFHPIRDSPVPSFDRSKKPSDMFEPLYTKNDLRIVIVPTKIMTQFQQIAQKNTINNIETCGILAGKLAKNELIVTHMILPKQKGTSDSCTTMNEEELFDFQDQQNLITIGWIHTHPTQTAFLSSVDLHTQCPYQLLMPEAVAIVCAPRYNETRFFVLTPEHGLKYIANCRKTGFHPHPTDPPLFKDAEHVKIDQNATLEVLDLRT